MDFELFKSIVDEADQYGSRSFSLHLFGETFLYPRLFDAVRYIKQKRKSHTILLTTNGTYMERYVDELCASAVDQVYWSWRPEAVFTPETKEKLRKWGRFRVRFIKEITPPEAYEEWKDWPNVEGRNMHSYGGEIDTEKFGGSNNTEKRWSCYHLYYAPAVAWNGDILLCCCDSHHRQVLGKFPQQSVAHVWQGEEIARVRTEHSLGQYKGICENCTVYKEYPDVFFKWQKR